MNKKNFIIIFFILIFTISCGYTPIYTNKNVQNIQINITTMTGDDEINNLINLKLKKYDNLETTKSFDVEISSTYEKEVVAKDSTGSASDFLLSTEIIVTIVNQNIPKQTLIINEKFNMKNIDDELKQRQYEKSIKEMFVNQIIQKLILKLSTSK